LSGILCGLLATAAALIIGLWPVSISLESAAVAATILATYLALAFGYWTFLNLNITSLRIRILREILRCPSGISRGDLLERYSSEEFLRHRLARLANARQMICRDGRWRLESPTLLLLARTMAALRVLALPAHARRSEN